jgi:hypothetical protein
MQTLTVLNYDQEVARLGETSGDLCRCKSCRADVRRDLHGGYLGFFFKRVRAPTGLVKLKVVTIAVVCSELCGQRLNKTDSQTAVAGWEFQSLDQWFGERGFLERDDFIHDHWIDREVRNVRLPSLLHAITMPVGTVIKLHGRLKEAVGESV